MPHKERIMVALAQSVAVSRRQASKRTSADLMLVGDQYHRRLLRVARSCSCRRSPNHRPTQLNRASRLLRRHSDRALSPDHDRSTDMLGKHRFASVNYPTFTNHVSYYGGVLQNLFVAHHNSPTLKNWRTMCVNSRREDELYCRIRRQSCDMRPKFLSSLGSESDRDTSTTVTKRD